MFQSVSNFAWRNRGKLTIALAVSIGVAAYATYTSYSSTSPQSDNSQAMALPSSASESSRSSLKSKTKSRTLLFRIRRQYEVICAQFLATLRGKIIDIVDISAAIRQIKELRSSVETKTNISISRGPSSQIDSEEEGKLWEELKIASFTQLFVTAYTVSIVCVILRIQMHIIAKYSNELTKVTFESSMENYAEFGVTSDHVIESDGMENMSIFRKLIDGTYKHLFSSGLRTLTSLIRQLIISHLKDWTIKDKITVEYGEMIQMMSQIRRSIERDMSNLIKIMIIRKSNIA